MQFTTVRSKEKDQLFRSVKNCKKLVPSYFEPDKHCCSYLEREKSGSLLFGDQKMQFTTVRSKEKDYDIYLKSEKLVHSQQEHEKNVSQLFGSGKNWFLGYFEPDKHCCSYLEERKKRIPAIWRPKNVVHNCQEQGKDYDIYLKSEKLVHRQQELEKNVSQLFGSVKNWSLAISSLTNTVAAIWREKKVDPCYLETKKCSLQLLGARKKIMTSI